MMRIPKVEVTFLIRLSMNSCDRDGKLEWLNIVSEGKAIEKKRTNEDEPLYWGSTPYTGHVNLLAIWLSLLLPFAPHPPCFAHVMLQTLYNFDCLTVTDEL